MVLACLFYCMIVDCSVCECCGGYVRCVDCVDFRFVGLVVGFDFCLFVCCVLVLLFDFIC